MGVKQITFTASNTLCENLSRPSVTQHAASILGQMYTKVRTRGGKGLRRGDGGGGIWGEERHRKESATQRQAAVITVGLC